MSLPSASAPAVVELDTAQVHAGGVVSCPSPRMTLWSTHPKVYLALAPRSDGDGAAYLGAQCPYCGTVYRLRAGDVLPAH